MKDPIEFRRILENSKKIKKLKIHILEDMGDGPYLFQVLQWLMFPKFERLEYLSISTFLSFEDLMKLDDSLQIFVEESNHNTLKLLEVDIKPICTNEQLKLVTSINRR